MANNVYKKIVVLVLKRLNLYKLGVIIKLKNQYVKPTTFDLQIR
jgi:hypothetical protein